jgi:ABC-type nitrate/sulfonate/bicarbonate transport system substrate-binding protein
VKAFNQALTEAIQYVQSNPEEAVQAVKDNFKLPADKLFKSLNRTHYTFVSGSDLQKSINDYFRVIGKPLDESDTAFYLLSAQ